MRKTAVEASSPLARNAYLDFLRALAITSVVFVHSASYLDDHLKPVGAHLPPLLRLFTDLGAYGVPLFFVISGWLLQQIYGDGSWKARSYFARRFARIYPLWVGFLVFSFLVPALGLQTGISELLAGQPLGNWVRGAAVIVLAATTFTLWVSPELWNRVVPGGWSIQAEVGHYLVFPLLRRLRSYQIVGAIALVRLATSGLSIAAQNLPMGNARSLIEAWIRLGLSDSLVFFVFGMVACRWFASRRHLGWRDLLAALLLAESLLLWVPDILLIPSKFVYIGVCLAITRLALMAGRSWPSVNAVGRYSYFVYYAHFFVLHSIVSVLLATGGIVAVASSTLSAIASMILLAVFTLAASVVLGKFSWRFIEKPIMDWSRRF
jgi:peptidoglycan/LPS O-acetylase OafA/YrhL